MEPCISSTLYSTPRDGLVVEPVLTGADCPFSYYTLSKLDTSLLISKVYIYLTLVFQLRLSYKLFLLS